MVVLSPIFDAVELLNLLTFNVEFNNYINKHLNLYFKNNRKQIPFESRDDEYFELVDEIIAKKYSKISSSSSSSSKF